jgi:hypothetical protein
LEYETSEPAIAVGEAVDPNQLAVSEPGTQDRVEAMPEPP